jgi:hypothetical protein
VPNGFHTPPFGWDGEIRPANRAALAAARPWAWRRILDGLPTSRRPDGVNRPGQAFNLSLDGRLLHAPRDPEAEARSLVRAARPERRQALIVVGFGAGYVVEQALRGVPTGCGVVAAVIDPGAFLETLAGRDLPDLIGDPRLVLAVGNLREVEAAIPADASALAWILHVPLLAAVGPEFDPIVARARAAAAAPDAPGDLPGDAPGQTPRTPLRGTRRDEDT